MAHNPQPIALLTGAAGQLGRVLAQRLSACGWQLRMTDIRPFPDALPRGARFFEMSLEDKDAVIDAAAGCDLILHYGGISTEQSFEEILGPNYRGTFHIYEAARRHRARVVFPSSVHVVGLYDRSETLDQDCVLRPDGYYGLSKAYGEMLARVYWEKHAVESVVVRIGSTLPEPTDRRFLSTWLSHDDFIALMQCCAQAEHVGFTVIWGASDNSRSFWRDDGRVRIGWRPKDSSDGFIDQVEGIVTQDVIAESLQGGRFVTVDYTRDGLPPKDLF
ncbi:NAD(P)-dependent oxidoreductase [Acidisoma cellulosilytica]|uniref:NAD(P)-dependent oxidoreductase n=1 Tax=Acidisoma cellulosilyticum TaxID=2802395 RepID=A0A963Z5G1_9PROT|nr:NAD(P)-dependent oxidoreductase [Acidisoma cellulosilyticum]MCB8882222.1 NAD(P)-dependent oxidoreductase [Acidisoma cellulosilyticum]